MKVKTRILLTNKPVLREVRLYLLLEYLALRAGPA